MYYTVYPFLPPTHPPSLLTQIKILLLLHPFRREGVLPSRRRRPSTHLFRSLSTHPPTHSFPRRLINATGAIGRLLRLSNRRIEVVVLLLFSFL